MNSMFQTDGGTLKVKGLRVAFGALVALDDVSWEVRPGEILGIIGPNGAGKSTCYNATTNMVPRTGRVEIDGHDVTGVPASRLAALGLRRAFQQNAFFTHLTVLENMIAVIQPEHGTGLLSTILRPISEHAQAANTRILAAEALEHMGIPAEFHDRLPGEVPYGTQRMLSIALANGAGARILLLDEPAAGLGGEDMRKLCDRLTALRAGGMAIVVIEHHMDLVMQITDRIVVLDRGRRLAYGTPAEIRQDPHVLEAYLGRDE
jgi:branched-chain amino acid transport system ATP-binding protein